jgi:hypothetical protein
MNNAALKLALKKQRLQIDGERLRADFGFNAAGLAPAFAGADLAIDGVHWVRRNPEVVVAVLVALVVIRPSRAWRWGRRAFIGWQAWRKLRIFMDRRLPA